VEPTLKLKIDSFSGQYRFLSNFYPANVMQLWHAPANGGARKITADDVNWETM
jgi:hypothetical protein